MSVAHAKFVPVSDRANVPCNGCTACCRCERVVLMPNRGDDVLSYQTEPVVGGPWDGMRMLAHKDDLSCVYLGEGGCTIWERAPVLCRTFDCRAAFVSKTRAERRRMLKLGLAHREVMEAGRERLHTLR